jgi:hypothetical protein
MSIEDVTNEVEWSTSKLVRIENGQVGISVSDLTALLAVYGVSDKDRVEELRRLARATRQRTWWSSYQRYIPGPLWEFIGVESDAKRIRHYHPTAVPGLLQTEQYAGAINEATLLTKLPPDVVKARNEVRLMRQKHVLHREDPPSYQAMVDEAVLRRPVGGEATMRQQLDHLIKLAGGETITIVVVPFSAGPHPGLMGAFALMEYDDPLNDDVVCLENPSGNIIVRDKPETVAEYRAAAERIVSLGLRGDEAVAFIKRIRKELT